jgi:DNA-binding NtrC family response regulator
LPATQPETGNDKNHYSQLRKENAPAMHSPAIANAENRRGMLTIAASLVFESGISLAKAEDEFRRETIKFQLTQYRGNQCKVARMLGVHRNTLSRMMKLLGIESDHDHWRNMYCMQQDYSTKFVAQSASGSSTSAEARPA